MLRQYATRDEVINTVNTWAEKVAPEFALTHLAIHGESVTHFRAVFHHDKLRLDVTIGIVPTANNTGWYVNLETMWNLEEKPQYEWEQIKPYDDNLQALMTTFPTRRITHIDNEGEDDWPVFGYGVIDADNLVQAFIQHPKPTEDEEYEDYWKNDDLPYSTIVYDLVVMTRINDQMHDYLVRNVDQLDKY